MYALEKAFCLKPTYFETSVSSTDSFFLDRRLFQMYILVLKNSYQIVVSLLYGFPFFLLILFSF